MPEIHDYIQSAKANGETNEAIAANLKAAGWDEVVINQAMGSFISPIASPTQPQAVLPPAQSKLSMIAKKYWKYGLLALVVALLVVGGAKGYTYFTSDPAKVWADTSQKMLDIKSAHFNLEASYSEMTPDDADSDSFFDSLFGGGDFKISLTGDGDMVLKPNGQDADYTMNSTVGYKIGSLNISLGLESKKIGDNVYYKLDGNPLLGLFGEASSGSEAASWGRINLTEQDNDLALLDSQKNQILEAFKKAKLLSPTKLLGSETVGGVATWHYQAALNKQELKTYIDQLQKIMNSSADEAKQAQAIVDKLDFKKLEIWIGKSDHLVHQAVIETNAPSFIQTSLGSARYKSRDARRMADMRQVQTALELFYNDNGRYPSSVDGQPSKTDGGEFKFSSYIYTFPVAPTPADGGCNESNNKYDYQQLDGGKEYHLTFCIGTDYGDYKAGIMQASYEGMKSITPLAGSPLDPLEGIVFGGSINIKLTLSNFDANVKIEEPVGAVNFGASSRDARRLADARQVMTALEIYYNDENKYPATLTDLTKKDPYGGTYLNSLPQAPTPVDGNCTEANNKYNYEQLSNGANYSLTLCIGGDTGGFKAGIIEASPNGLDNK